MGVDEVLRSIIDFREYGHYVSEVTICHETNICMGVGKRITFTPSYGCKGK